MSDQGRPTTTRGDLEVSGRSGQDGSGASARSPDHIVADIEATRRRLAGTIDAIGVRVAPKDVARRTVDSVKGKVAASLKASFIKPDGGVRTERVAPIAGFVALVILVRSIRTVRSRRR